MYHLRVDPWSSRITYILALNKRQFVWNNLGFDKRGLGFHLSLGLREVIWRFNCFVALFVSKHQKTHLRTSEKKIHACQVTGCRQRYTRSDALARHQWGAHGIRAKTSRIRPSTNDDQTPVGSTRHQGQDIQDTPIYKWRPDTSGGHTGGIKAKTSRILSLIHIWRCRRWP